jgi:hypothetical protein
MAQALAASIDHVGLNIPEESFGFWKELLAHLGFAIVVRSAIRCHIPHCGVTRLAHVTDFPESQVRPLTH